MKIRGTQRVGAFKKQKHVAFHAGQVGLSCMAKNRKLNGSQYKVKVISPRQYKPVCNQQELW